MHIACSVCYLLFPQTYNIRTDAQESIDVENVLLLFFVKLACKSHIFFADPLVLHFQFFYDGYLSYWAGVHDFDENP